MGSRNVGVEEEGCKLSVDKPIGLGIASLHRETEGSRGWSGAS